MTTPPTKDRSSGRLTSASSSPAEEEIGAPAANQPAGTKPVEAGGPAIHCHKCKHVNAPDAQKCARCGANLLPGTSLGQRFWILVFSTLMAVVIFYAFFMNSNKVEAGGKNALYLVALPIFGVLMFGYGIIKFLRKIPLDERYVNRARRHLSLNKLQTIADYGSAMQTAPQYLVLNYLIERAKLYQDLGMSAEAGLDWQRALEKINDRIARAKPPVPGLFKQRAELYKNLKMEDEYALEMLLYTIEKEKTFKFKRGHIAEGWEEGLKQGSEDAQRNELRKLRAEIMKNQKYGIVGQCKKCKSIVDLDARLDCTNNPKHLIQNISPTLRKIDPS